MLENDKTTSQRHTISGYQPPTTKLRYYDRHNKYINANERDRPVFTNNLLLRQWTTTTITKERVSTY